MFYTIWLSVHVIGVFVAGFLLYKISQDDASEYKGMLQMMVSTCLLALVARVMYILSGDSPMEILTMKKMEYAGKCFSTFFGILFILRFRDKKWPRWIINSMLAINIIVCGFILTTERHLLYYTSFEVVKRKSGYEMVNGHGPIHTFYMSFQILEMLIYAFYAVQPLFSGKISKMTKQNRNMQISLALSAILPSIFILLTNLSIVSEVDTNTLGILCSNVMLYIAIFGQGLFDDVKLAKESVLQNVDEGIIITDTQYSLLYVNDSAKVIFPNLHFAIGEDGEGEYKRILDSSDEIFEMDSKKYRIRVSGISKNNHVNVYAATIVDVTDVLLQADSMRELKEKAEKANEAKSFFLSNMSHEIRTPMNAIVGMTEIVLRNENLDDETKGYLDNIQNSGRSLIGIINDILDFSKIESGKMEITNVNFSPASRLGEIGMIFLTRIGEKDIRLLFDIDPDLPSVINCDSLKIRQVLINIVNNAIKFTEKGFVKVTIRVVSKTEDECTLYAAVEDSGQGIKSEDMDKLFNSFERLDSKRNYEKEGTGLGLAISKQLIELLGGELHVESEFGVGSRFYTTMTVPVKDASPAMKLRISEAEQKSLVISSYLGDDQETAILEELCRHFEIEYVDYSDMVRQKRKVTHFFIDQMQYREVGSDLKELVGSDVEIVVLYNPMIDVLEDENITLMPRPLFGLNFSALLSHEKLTASNKEVVDYNTFIAPDANVLIVDDNKMNLKVALGLLEPLKMNVDVAESGKQAIEMIREKTYDLVFMDHMMPVMDGIEATQYIREMDNGAFKDLIIIALSANTVAGAREMFLENGMNDFIAKPIEVQEINGKIRHWLPDDIVVPTVASPMTDESEEDLSEFEQIRGIDPKEGIKNSGSKKLFASLLTDFYKLIDLKANKIEKCLADGMLKDYTIEVHALKNTARMIGAIDLSESFKRMEELGNAQDQETLDLETPAVLARFRAYKEYLKDYATQDQGDLVETDSETLRGLFEQIISGMNEFDLDAVDDAMVELEKYKLPEACGDKMDELRALVADVAMEEVAALANEMMESL